MSLDLAYISKTNFPPLQVFKMILFLLWGLKRELQVLRKTRRRSTSTPSWESSPAHLRTILLKMKSLFKTRILTFKTQKL